MNRCPGEGGEWQLDADSARPVIVKILAAGFCPDVNVYRLKKKKRIDLDTCLFDHDYFGIPL